MASVSTAVPTIPVGGNTGRQRLQIAGETLEIIPLGSGQEVGRSCVLMKFRGKCVMFDCGVHPGLTGLAQLPYFDRIDHNVDLALITHFHMDHSGAVPYFVNKCDHRFRNGKIFMTHPTKSICRMLWHDHSKINKINNDEQIYSFKDIEKAMLRVELIDFHEHIDLDGIRLSCYTAGHVLGAAMFMVEIAGIRVLYTGDYSREIDRHLCPAEVPPMRIHVLIVESTYGTQSHEDRKTRENRFLSKAVAVVKNGGKVLLPSFALGRAQELLLMLEEHWAKSPELQNIPIYYNSPMALKCSRIFETFTNLCSKSVIEQATQTTRNPWQLQYIKALGTENREKVVELVNNRQPCVVLAAPGMLQNGFSRELFEMWAPGKGNAVIMTGYSVEGTIAKDLETQPDKLHMPDGRIVHINCHIDNISFSAHSDYNQTSQFIKEIKTNHVILVHGEESNMRRMQAKLRLEHGDQLKVYAPANTQSIAMTFNPDLGVTIAGKLAEDLDRDRMEGYNNLPADGAGGGFLPAGAGLPGSAGYDNDGDNDGNPLKRKKLNEGESGFTKISQGEMDERMSTNISGILVEDAYGARSLIAPSELSSFTKLEVCSFEQTQKLQYKAPNLEMLAKAVEGIYEDVHLHGDNCERMTIQSCVKLKQNARTGILEISWKASPMADMIADSIVLVALELTRSPSAVQALSMGSHLHSDQVIDLGFEDRLFSVWTTFLDQTYGECEVEVEPVKTVKLEVDNCLVHIDFAGREVEVEPIRSRNIITTPEDELIATIKKDISDSLERCERSLKPVPKFVGPAGN